MFLIRWGFWIVLAVMLLPTDKAQQERLMQQASAAAQWTWTFCDRNVSTCERAGEFWSVFQTKAQFALAMAGDIVRERALGAPSSAVTTPGIQPTAQPTVPATRRVPTLPVVVEPGSPSPSIQPVDAPALVRPVKPQDRLPLYPQQRVRLED